MWWQFQSSGICLESDGLSFEVVCLAFCKFSHYFDHAQSKMKYMCKKKKQHNFYITKYIWKKKNSTTGLAGGLFGLRGERLLKRARSYDENTSASPHVRARKFAAFSSLVYPFTKQTASYALTATQARLPCACVQMALACTALFFVIFVGLPWFLCNYRALHCPSMSWRFVSTS